MNGADEQKAELEFYGVELRSSFGVGDRRPWGLESLKVDGGRS